MAFSLAGCVAMHPQSQAVRKRFDFYVLHISLTFVGWWGSV